MAYRELSDAELVSLIAGGQERALEELYERHHRRVFSFALGIVNNRMTAEEVVQDAFSRVWSRASTYRPELGKASSWLLSIAHHRAIDVLRRQRHEQANPGYDEALGHELMRHTEGGLEEYAISLETGSRVHKLLAQLPEAQREVVVLAYFYGYTQSEIANKTKQPLGTVKTRMRSALMKLRGLLGATEGSGAV